MKNLTERIKEHAAENYASSPHEFSEEDINVIIEDECKCRRCGKSIFELWDFPKVIDESTYCEDCEHDEFYAYCNICEESYEDSITPEETQIVVTKSLAKEHGMKPGIYQVLSFPYTRNCLVFGFESFIDGSLKLLRKLDIERVLNSINKLSGRNENIEITSGCICPECVEKYVEEKAPKYQWTGCTDEQNKEKNAKIIKIIKKG